MPGTESARDALDASWSALGAFLARDLVLLPRDVRERLQGEWEEVSEAERNLDDLLVVGLVGGTGVGKSTLINALAGAEISKSGDRRPTTDRVIVYRHARTELPDALPRGDVATPEITHETPPLERVVLLDFPDFDSVEELHHEVLERFQPHLDVLVIVVDDMKYGDLRLFDLLARLPQSHENLHGVLNKVDRLERRYPGEWRRVADEILDDFAAKLRLHARIKTRREGLFAISARNALAERLDGAPGASNSPSLDGGGLTGDFPGIVSLIQDYRLEKRRRRAKELNLDARKAAFRESLRARALGPREAERIARAAAEIERRRLELERTLAGIPAAVFDQTERRSIVSRSLGRGAGRFGFPIDFILTLGSRIRAPRGARRQGLGEVTEARVREHYRAYLDGVENLRRDISLEAGDLLEGAFPSKGEPRGAGPGEAAPPPAEELQRGLTLREEALARRPHWWNHALAVFMAALCLWSVFYPAVRSTVRRLAGESDASWSDVLKDLFSSLFASIHPMAIAGFIFWILLAYAATAAIVWVRQVQRFEEAITETEDSLRARVRDEGSRSLEGAAAAAARWQEERAELERVFRG
ncbi:MAG TPA: GTPase [Planctomycetota bacterium]|nr:GTPase [Planctomycetota bacterium]